MEDTSGFYKQENEKLLHAPNGVMSCECTLMSEFKDTYEFPVDGWYWFVTKEEAYNFFGIELTND